MLQLLIVAAGDVRWQSEYPPQTEILLVPLESDHSPPRHSVASLTASSNACAQHKRLHIGLVNNMPDKALEATERQFFRLLYSSTKGLSVKVSLYALPDIPRGRSGRERIQSSYEGISDLWERSLDGLIVTGTEPVAKDLAGEPYWESLKKVVEWAEDNTYSTIWSCLAAHAAVLHMDGIARSRLENKRFGVLKCTRWSDHQLTTGTPSCFDMPHSRWNDLHETELAQAGYRVLTRTSDGADAFIKQKKSRFLFFQGHPEYEADTLLLEYRRDIRRFLLGRRDSYPTVPDGCLDRDVASTLSALAQRAVRCPSEELLVAAANALRNARIVNTWRPVSMRIYSNWLTSISLMKERAQRQRPVACSAPPHTCSSYAR